MNKEELKQYLESLQLEEGLKTLMFGLIDKASEVDQSLLNTVADILGLQADFCQQHADLLYEQADLHETLAAEFNALDEEEKADKMEALLEHHKTLLDSLNKKTNEVNEQHDTDSLAQIKEQLQQVAQPAPSSPAESNPPTPPADPAQ